MTICISAICEKGEKAVVALDRMITSEALSIEFEQDLCKIEGLSDTCVVTSAGDALEPKDILRDTKIRVNELTKPTIRQITDIIKEYFILRRKKNVEDELLKPRGFKDLDDFYGKMRMLPPDVYTVLDNQISRFHILTNSMTTFLVTGIDNTGAHIYLVHDPGRTVCFDSIGFHAVGSGTPHAVSLFTSYNYTDKLPLNLAIWVVYEAKRRAEKAPGVGKGTDMCVIGSEVTYLPKEVLSQLEEMFAQKEKQDKVWLENIPQFTVEGKE